jgi:crotonobetainyl-CoA:carnitine CoA-transferase CaiB-like acyl-CoA transferase
MDRDEYKTDKDRAINYLELAGELDEMFTKETRNEWLRRLEAENVPCGPILNMAETFDHPQVKNREMAVEVEHPTAGKTRVLGFPPKLSETPGIVRRPAPTLGQHTDEVIGELGKSGEEILALRDEGVLV